MGLAQPSELAVCLQAGAAVDGWYPRFERLYGGWLFSVNQPSLWKNTPSIAEIELHFLPETINFVVFFCDLHVTVTLMSTDIILLYLG